MRERGARSIPSFRTADRLAVMRERGARFVDDPHIIAGMGSYELWMTGFRDSKDNDVCLMNEVPKS